MANKDREKARAAQRRFRAREHAKKYGPDAGNQRGIHKNHASGPNHYRWSEERMVDDDGYIKLRVGVEHPLADPNGYAYEHLVIWAAAGNPRPPKGFLLHHKDEHKSNNQIGNLELLPSNREHAAEHGRLKLNEIAARDIRIRYAMGQATQAELAAEYGVPMQRVSKIIHGKVWKSAGGPISTEDNRVRDPRTGRVIGKKAAGHLLDGVEHREVPR